MKSNISKIIFLIGSLILPTWFINHEIIIILSFIILIGFIITNFGDIISQSLTNYCENICNSIKIKFEKPNQPIIKEKVDLGYYETIFNLDI